MGALGVTVNYRRTRKRSPSPEKLLESLWGEIHQTIDGFVRDRPVQQAVVRSMYAFDVVGKSEAGEGELTYVFSDFAGTSHLSMYAFAHWAERALYWLAPDGGIDRVRDRYGVVIVLDREKALERLLRREDSLLYEHKNRLFALEQGSDDKVRLCGDGADVEDRELTAKERDVVAQILASRRCPCGLCKSLERKKASEEEKRRRHE